MEKTQLIGKKAKIQGDFNEWYIVNQYTDNGDWFYDLSKNKDSNHNLQEIEEDLRQIEKDKLLLSNDKHAMLNLKFAENILKKNKENLERNTQRKIPAQQITIE